MFLHIKEILTPAQVTQLLELAKSATWQDGKVSNPHSKTKNNLQLEYGSPAHQQSAKILGEAIQRREEFNDFAFPKRMTPPLITKYLPGMNTACTLIPR